MIGRHDFSFEGGAFPIYLFLLNLLLAIFSVRKRSKQYAVLAPRP